MCFAPRFYLGDSILPCFWLCLGTWFCLFVFVFYFLVLQKKTTFKACLSRNCYWASIATWLMIYMIPPVLCGPCGLGVWNCDSEPIQSPLCSKAGNASSIQDLISHLSGQMALPSDRCSNQRIQLCLSASDASAFFPDKKMHCELNCLCFQQCHKPPYMPCLGLISKRVTQVTARKHNSDFSQPIL